MPPIYSHGNFNRHEEHVTTQLTEQMLSSKRLFFNTVTTMSYALLPAMNKSLHVTLPTMCTIGGDPLLKHTAHRLPALSPPVWFPEMFSKHQ